jgi:bisphosphoglycerate-dependent phosphoglycerate mutase
MRRWLKKKGIVFVVTHNNVINQIIAVLYGVQYEKVDIVFPHAEPLLLKIGKNGRVYYCKRIKL